MRCGYFATAAIQRKEEQLAAGPPEGDVAQRQGDTAKRAGGWVKISPRQSGKVLGNQFAVRVKGRGSSDWFRAPQQGGAAAGGRGTAMGGRLRS